LKWRVAFFCLLAIAMSLAALRPAQADVWTTWQHSPTTAGDWSDPTNWDIGLPASGISAMVANGGTATIGSPGSVCEQLYIGGSTGSGTVEMSAGDLSSYLAVIGSSTWGVFAQSGGTHTNEALYVGAFSSGNGSYTLSGSSVLAAHTEWVGCYSMGSFTQTGGTHSVGSLHVGGYASLANANFSLSGSALLSAGTEEIGYADLFGGTSTFTQTGGTNTAGFVGIHALYTLSDGLLNVTAGLTNRGNYGLSANGVLDLAGGSASVKASSAIVDLAGGALQNTQNATLTIDANSLLIVPKGYVPRDHWANYSNDGILHEDGTALTISAGRAVYGTGTIYDHVNCEGGTLTAAAGSYIKLYGGLSLSEPGVVNLGTADGVLGGNATISGGSLTVQNVRIAGSLLGYGVMTESGGLVTLDTIALGVPMNYRAEYNLSGSGVLAANTEIIGYGSGGTFTQTGGTNTIASALIFGRTQVDDRTSYGGAGTYTLSGGVLELHAMTAEGTAQFNFGGGTLRASGSFMTNVPMTLTGAGGNANVDTAGHTVELACPLSGPGGLNKRGGDKLILSAANTYRGNTAISAGTLTLASSGSLVFDINDATNSMTSVDSGAKLDLFGMIKLDLTDVSASSATWELIDNNGTAVYEPSFAVATIGGAAFTQVNNVWSYTAGSRQWTFSEATGLLSMSAVPEPSTAVLLGLGLCSLLVCAWRRRSIAKVTT
jgi:fibronectin-binding autotransporter adhesin